MFFLHRLRQNGCISLYCCMFMIVIYPLIVQKYYLNSSYTFRIQRFNGKRFVSFDSFNKLYHQFRNIIKINFVNLLFEF